MVDLIRGKGVAQALGILKFTPRHAALVVEKVLKSAVANASQKEMGDVDELWISKVCVDVGPTMKRVKPRAMGRSNTIRKRMSHITIALSGKADPAEPKDKKRGRAAQSGGGK